MRVVALADVLRIENAAGRGQRIDRRVNALFRDRALEVQERVELAEGRGRGRVGRVVGRHVNGLHRRDGPLLRRGDPLLQRAHFRGQGRLITHGRGHAAQQGRHLAAGLREAEDVVDEQQRVGPGRVAEVFGHGQGRQRHPKPSPRRLVHLAEHHARLLDHFARPCRRWPLPAFPATGRYLRGSARPRRRTRNSRRGRWRCGRSAR